jgi:hypothetical protein
LNAVNTKRKKDRKETFIDISQLEEDVQKNIETILDNRKQSFKRFDTFKQKLEKNLKSRGTVSKDWIEEEFNKIIQSEEINWPIKLAFLHRAHAYAENHDVRSASLENKPFKKENIAHIKRKLVDIYAENSAKFISSSDQNNNNAVSIEPIGGGKVATGKKANPVAYPDKYYALGCYCKNKDPNESYYLASDFKEKEPLYSRSTDQKIDYETNVEGHITRLSLTFSSDDEDTIKKQTAALETSLFAAINYGSVKLSGRDKELQQFVKFALDQLNELIEAKNSKIPIVIEGPARSDSLPKQNNEFRKTLNTIWSKILESASLE